MSRSTMASFSLQRRKQVFSKRSSRNNESFGTDCAISSKVLQSVMQASVGVVLPPLCINILAVARVLSYSRSLVAGFFPSLKVVLEPSDFCWDEDEDLFLLSS